MASTIKVDKLEGSTGSTITVPTGQTLTLTDGLGISSLPTVTVAKGGTNLTSFTAGDVLYATGSTTLAKLTKGTAEQVLAMNAGATAPDWGSVDLTVLPTISVAKGGTNVTSFTAGDILYATGTTTLAKLAKGTGLQTLQMNAGATAPNWTTVAAPSGGLDVSDVWRIHTGLTVDITNADLTANWERADGTGIGSLGTGLTESSGVFTFPSTGFWTCTWGFHISHGGGVQSRYGGGRIYHTTDNTSTWVEIGGGGGSIPMNYTTTWSNNFHAFAQLDVTDVSNDKLKFSAYAENTGDFWASSTKNSNWIHFAKVGAT
jgi:hypothetical protein